MIAITAHAAERYVERVDPSMTLDEARSHLGAVALSATRMKERTKYGQLRYLTAACVLVVKETPDRGLMAVSVYPLPAPRGIPAREWEMALERAATRAHAMLDEREIPRADPPPAAPKDPPPKVAPRTASQPDHRLERVLADLDHALERFHRAGAHMDAARRASDVALAEKVQERTQKYVDHGNRMTAEREEIKRVLRALGPHIPDAPEVREVLGRFAAIVFPEAKATE